MKTLRFALTIAAAALVAYGLTLAVTHPEAQAGAPNWPGGKLLAPAVITAAMTATTSTSLVPAVSGSYLYITSCAFSNDHATVDTLMRLQDGSGGTTIWQGMVPHGAGNDPIFPVPKQVPTRGNALFVVNVTTGSSTYASCEGWSSPVNYGP